MRQLHYEHNGSSDSLKTFRHYLRPRPRLFDSIQVFATCTLLTLVHTRLTRCCTQDTLQASLHSNSPNTTVQRILSASRREGQIRIDVKHTQAMLVVSSSTCT